MEEIQNTKHEIRDDMAKAIDAFSKAEIEEKLEEISRTTGVVDILNLPATSVFKIRAQFDL